MGHLTISDWNLFMFFEFAPNWQFVFVHDFFEGEGGGANFPHPPNAVIARERALRYENPIFCGNGSFPTWWIRIWSDPGPNSIFDSGRDPVRSGFRFGQLQVHIRSAPGPDSVSSVPVRSGPGSVISRSGFDQIWVRFKTAQIKI